MAGAVVPKDQQRRHTNHKPLKRLRGGLNSARTAHCVHEKTHSVGTCLLTAFRQ